MDLTRQVGHIAGHAVMWFGTAKSAVELEPHGKFSSNVHDVRGSMQVGTVLFPFNVNHAALWYGTAASWVDLHPAGAVRSIAYATDGILQGGLVRWTTLDRAAIWSGTAQTVVDLSPQGRHSRIYAMAPGIQVGEVSLPLRASVWRGTAQSWVDMHPPGQLGGSRFYGTTGRIHVGTFGPPEGLERAAINFGTPEAWLDLHQFLPPGYPSWSAARDVYQSGDTIYVGGYAYNDASPSAREAILWIGVLPCYANCDESTIAPLLTIADFSCFLQRFAAGDGYANCDKSTTAPLLNVADFSCFLQKFAGGCP